MRYVRTYFTRGAVVDRHKVRIPFAIKDPPVAGSSHAFILGEGKKLVLFHPFTLQAYGVTEDAEELAIAEDVDYDPKIMADMITAKWKDYKTLDMQRDYGTAAAVLLELGAEVPEDTPMTENTKGKAVKKAGGKPLEEDRLKPLKPKGKRFEVAAFFMKPASILAGMAKLNMTRSGLLSHLYCIWRDHGVGYEVMGDTARLLLPDDISDLFLGGTTVEVECDNPEELEDFLS